MTDLASNPNQYAGQALTEGHPEFERLSQLLTPRPRLSLDPELTDGEHRAVYSRPDGDVTALIEMWMNEAEPGDKFTVELVMMTDAEVASLPDM